MYYRGLRRKAMFAVDCCSYLYRATRFLCSMNLGFIQSRESMITYSYFLHTREGGVMGGKRKEVVTFTMPEGDTIP